MSSRSSARICLNLFLDLSKFTLCLTFINDAMRQDGLACFSKKRLGYTIVDGW